MRVMFLADLQLGAGQALGNGEWGEGSRLADQEAMLARIWEICSEEQVELVCCLGDVFDRARPAPHEILIFQAFVRQVIDSGRKMFTLTGNHDTRSAALPTALEIFADHNSVVCLQPSLFPIGDIALAALPWTPPSRIVSANPGRSRDEINDLAAQSLVEGAHLLSARCHSEHPDKTPVLVGHWAVSGAKLPTGLDSSMLREPVIPLEGLTSSGFALALFGHIHSAGMLAAGPCPVGFTGSPWVNDWGETQEAHGVWIYESAGAGSLKFHAIADPKRFVTLEPTFVDATAMGQTRPDYVPTFPSPVPSLDGALVRVKYAVSEKVAVGFDTAAFRRQLLAQGALKVVFRPTVERTVRARAQEASADLAESAALEMWISSQQLNGALADGLREAHGQYMARVR